VGLTVRRAAGALFGLAYGDALAAHPPPAELPSPAPVTEETRTALAVAWALHEADGPTPQLLEPLLRKRLGEAYAGTGGAVARAVPVGLAPGYDLQTLSGTAQLLAALVSGDPAALAASELAACAVWWLRHGEGAVELPRLLRERCAAQREAYPAEWLGDLWRRTGDADPPAFAARGWDACRSSLDRLVEALRRRDDGRDANRATGDGRAGHDVLTGALYCALRHRDDPVGGLERAAAASGETAAIAALTGALLGAAHGVAAWPERWGERVEYADQLAALAAAWDE
jgi:ADP-ribosylglycohydrolase